MDVLVTLERFNVNVSLQSPCKSLQALLYVYNKGKDRRCLQPARLTDYHTAASAGFKNYFLIRKSITGFSDITE